MFANEVKLSKYPSSDRRGEPQAVGFLFTTYDGTLLSDTHGIVWQELYLRELLIGKCGCIA